MAKEKIRFVCTSCGAGFSKWLGRCAQCDEWNTVVEAETEKPRKKSGDLLNLSSVKYDEIDRIKTGIGEFNQVCGGGLVPGSAILIGGEPGIGKSTLAMQIAGGFRAMYISGEESPAQLRHRAERIGVDVASMQVFTGTDVEEIIPAARKEKPQCLFVDSIQTLHSSEIPGVSGTVAQIRHTAAKMIDFAKETGIPVILIGHITKDGAIAGPKLLEHLVDTVLYFEGDFSLEYRILRAFKNRFGSVNEIGLFQMSGSGLAEVKDKNSVFLNPSITGAPGSSVSAAMEGSRTILFEVQSLVTYSSYPNPRRMSDGFDVNRLILITAVLEKFSDITLNAFDVFINVSGGYQIRETASDLAVAAAIVSSLKNRPVDRGIGVLGEISLSGEVRPVSQCERRIAEFRYSGFHTLVLPEKNIPDAKSAGFTENLAVVQTVNDAIEHLFKS